MKLAVIIRTLLSCAFLFSIAAPAVFASNHGQPAIEPLNPVGADFSADNHPIPENTFTLLFDTHFHGNFGDPAAEENIANYFGLANRIKAQNPNALYVGNGDDLATSLLSSLFNGQHMIDAFNAGKLDVNTYGNHEFDMGPDQLAKMVEASDFQWVSANVMDKRTKDVFGKEQGAARFVIKEVNGVKLGFTGLINEEAPQITSMGPNAQVIDPVEAMKKAVPEMKAAGAQIIIVSSHLAGPDARLVADQVEGIDVMIGDHAAKAFDAPEKIDDTLLWFIGDEFEYFGELNFYVKDGSIQDFNFRRYTLKEEANKPDFKPDAAVKTVMDDYVTKLGTELSVEIGSTATELDVMKATQRKQETAIGNFIADAMKAYTGADAALINGGGIRAERVFPVGKLTKKDIMDALPFTNYVVKIKVTGEQLLQALENAVSELEKGAGRFAQVSGMQYAYDLSKPSGSRIVNVKVNGKPLDKSASYSLATVDFLAEGGDGYEAFKSAEVLLDKNAGPLLSNLMIDTIQQQRKIAPKVEGRIVQAEPAKAGQPEPSKQKKPASATVPAAEAQTKVYIVKPGDTLWAIGVKNGTTWQRLRDLNKLTNPHLIYPGQKVALP